MVGAFLDRERPPTPDEIDDALGEARPLWRRVASAIETTYGVVAEPWFYGKESGWVARYRRAGKALLVLLPSAGRCSAVVVIGPSTYPAAMGLQLGPAVRTALESAHEYPEGRWVRVEVASQEIADDVVRLVETKSPPPRRRREVTRAERPTPAA